MAGQTTQHPLGVQDDGEDSTRETPFMLAYGNDAVIPAKVGLTNFRVAHYKDEESENQLRLSLNLIDEVRAARYKNLMTKHHDVLVKPRQFNIRDHILKRVSLTTKDLAHGKLGSNQEGPYKVVNYKR